MGRTSKLSRKFDMILVAILLMGMLMVLLYLAGRYECGEGIALIIGGVFVIIIGLCFFRNTVIIRYKKNGLVATRDEEVCLCGTEVVIEEDKLRQNIVRKALEFKNLASKVELQVRDIKKRYESCLYMRDKINFVFKDVESDLSAIYVEMQDMEMIFFEIQNLSTLLLRRGELPIHFKYLEEIILNFKNKKDDLWKKIVDCREHKEKESEFLNLLNCDASFVEDIFNCLDSLNFDITIIGVFVEKILEEFLSSALERVKWEPSMSQLVIIAIGLLMIGMGVCRVCPSQEEIDQVGKDDSIVINDDTMIVNRNSGGTSFIIVEKQKAFQDSILNVCLDIKEMLQKNHQIVSDIQMKVTEMSEKESCSVAYDLKREKEAILTEIKLLQKQVEQIQDTMVVQDQDSKNNQGFQLFNSKLSDNIHININTLVEKANEMDAKVRSLQDKIDK